jgi:hypothetical protein
VKRGEPLPSVGWPVAIQEQINRAFLKQVARDQDSLLPPQPKPSKYRNIKTYFKSVQGFGRTYDSIKEAKYAAGLDQLMVAGQIRCWLPQVSFPLPGDVRYRCDFMWIDNDWKVRFFDVKGKPTQASLNKIKQVLDLFGVIVEIV